MAEDFDLIAEYREDQGKGASRRLRRDGKVPAIIYGGGRPPRALSFDHNSVLHQLEDEGVFSSILNVKVGDKAQAAILKDLQRHPAKRQILHMDLQRVVEDQEIRVNVPIRYLNEDIAVGVKQGGGKVAHLISDVEVVCLPRYLPEFLEVDIAELELDEMLYLSDIKLPEGVELPDLAQGKEQDQPIVSIHIIKEVPIEEEELEEGVAVEAAAEGEAAPEAEEGGEEPPAEES